MDSEQKYRITLVQYRSRQWEHQILSLEVSELGQALRRLDEEWHLHSNAERGKL